MTIAILLLATLADMPKNIGESSAHYLCENIHDMAVAVHEKYYEGESLADATKSIPPSYWVKGVSESAYQRHVFNDPKEIMRDRRAFALKWQYTCLDDLGS